MDPKGLSTTYHFNHGLTSGYGFSTSALASGQGIDTAATRMRLRGNQLARTRQHDPCPIAPQGETVQASRQLFQRYSANDSDRTPGVLSE